MNLRLCLVLPDLEADEDAFDEEEAVLVSEIMDLDLTFFSGRLFSKLMPKPVGTDFLEKKLGISDELAAKLVLGDMLTLWPKGAKRDALLTSNGL